MKLIILFVIFSVSGCSTYVKRWHQQLDIEQAQNTQNYKIGPKKNKHFDLYRQNDPNKKFSNMRPLLSPGNSLHSTNASREILPKTQRSYQPSTGRTRARDLVDRANEGSLWSGMGQENYLFARNNIKKHGDIVVIEVQGSLKREISLELARAFPQMVKTKKKKKGDKPTKTPDEPAEDKAPGGAKIHDRVSSVVIEEVSNDHLLIRGRKDVLYKKRKRLVEIQALVARRDISDEDSVQSSKILESSVAVLR